MDLFTFILKGTVYTTTYVELIVQVQQGQTAGELQLHEMTCCNFGESFGTLSLIGVQKMSIGLCSRVLIRLDVLDLPTYERMCLVSAQHPDVC